MSFSSNIIPKYLLVDLDGMGRCSRNSCEGGIRFLLRWNRIDWVLALENLKPWVWAQLFTLFTASWRRLSKLVCEVPIAYMRRSSTYNELFMLAGMTLSILLIASENRVQLITLP